MLPAFPIITTQIDNDVDLDDLKSSVLSNKLVMLKWIQTTEKQLKNEIKKTKSKILTESKREINYVDEILKEKLTIASKPTTMQTSLMKQCSFDCKRPNLPYSNYCTEHITQNKDQQLFRRCSVKLSANQQCPNSSLLNNDKDVCQKHSQLKENNQAKQNTPKRKYAKNCGNENKTRKSRKKKDDKCQENGDAAIRSTDPVADQPTNGSTTSNLISDSLSFNDNQKSQPFASFSVVANYSSNDLNENYAYETIGQHGLIDYAPCITNLNNNDLDNLNQLSNLNQSEDSLVAIVNNDLTSIPFEESELNEMLGKIGKIPEDAFNDLFMDNLSTESSELRAIDNVAFNGTDVQSLEPSISNQAFSSSLNFKNSSTYFAPNDLQMNGGGLIYSGGGGAQQQNNIDLNNLNNRDGLVNQFGGGGGDGICTMQNGSNSYGSYNVIDYKSIQQTSYSSSNLVHHNYTQNGSINNFNSTYLDSYSSGDLNANQTILNGHSNNHHHFNATNSLNGSYNGNLLTNPNTRNLSNNPTTDLSSSTNPNYLDCNQSKADAQLDKKFNLFSGCKDNKNYSSTYSNIYDDLPSFEANRVNGTSLPSFSIMRKNHIESR